MSLLSAPQGSPDRVYSLLRLLAACGPLKREEIIAWMNPEIRVRDQPQARSEDAAAETIHAALSLQLIHAGGERYSLPSGSAPATQAEFARIVHMRLLAALSDDPDHVVLQAFAWLVFQIDATAGFGWVTSAGNKTLADAINAALPARDQSDEGRRFNETKIAPWRRWLDALGLQRELPAGGHYPYVADRLSRELTASSLPVGEAIPASQLLRVVTEKMPYLDGGLLRDAAISRSGKRPPDHLSYVLSVALRDLAEEGRIEIGLRGDASNIVRFAPDVEQKSASYFILLEAGDA